jgi:hypothetical protein
MDDLSSARYKRTPGTAKEEQMDLEGWGLEGYRREAKRLVRAYRAGDESVRARALAVLGARERFLLSDAQHLLARESGYRTWAELRRTLPDEWMVDTGLRYGPGEPVRIRVRRRGRRYDLDDRGDAVRFAGKAHGWREAGERAVAPMNLSRNGTVFVPAVEGSFPDRDIEALARRIGESARAVYDALVELE